MRMMNFKMSIFAAYLGSLRRFMGLDVRRENQIQLLILPYKLHSIDSEDVLRIFVAVGLDTKS